MGGATGWGILSAGKICNDFTAVLKSLPADEHKVVAVAARQLENATKFAEKFNIPKAYGSYDELGTDPDVEVVYVGNIHPHHAEWCVKMLRAGKHVLCEKPATMNSRELEQVLAAAEDAGKFFMEGFWTTCFPVFERLHEELSKNIIGDVKLVSAEFGWNMLDRARIVQKDLGGGALMDVGCYCALFVDSVLGPQMPDRISATGFKVASGEVDEAGTITLVYPGNKLGVLTFSANCDLLQKGIIRGSKGILEVSKFWCPTEITFPSGTEHYPVPEVSGLMFVNSEGFRYEAMKVRECILRGDKEYKLMTHQSSRNIMAIMDEARRQLGVTYAADNK